MNILQLKLFYIKVLFVIRGESRIPLRVSDGAPTQKEGMPSPIFSQISICPKTCKEGESGARTISYSRLHLNRLHFIRHQFKLDYILLNTVQPT